MEAIDASNASTDEVSVTLLASGSAGRVSMWIDQNPFGSLVYLLVFYLAVVCAQGAVKLLWADELITFYIARQPGFGGIWRALAAGADPNPPISHLLMKLSTTLFGDGALAVRLPANLCVLLAIVGLWAMLLRWVRPVYALAGALAFMTTRGFDYAYDARSYAPLMGFAMASLALWMRSGDCAGMRRRWLLGGMSAALAAGLSANYYGVLAFFPIAAGEVVRARQRSRFAFGAWIAMAVASLPLLAYLPLIRHNIAEFAPHAWNSPHASMLALSYFELVEGIFWPVMALAIYSLWHRRSFRAMPSAEAAALAVLLLYPLLGFVIALGGAGMISPRCVAPVCCGFGLAAGLLAERTFGRLSRSAGVAVLAVLLLWVTAREAFCASLLMEQRQAFLRLRDQVTGADAGQIVVGDSSFVLPLYFYADDAVRSRIVFPIDFEAIHHYERDDSGEQNLWAGRFGVFPFPILRAGGFTLNRQDVLVIARPDGWLAAWMQAREGVALQPVGDAAEWGHVGGVFTPLAHAETRVLRVAR